MRLPSKKVISLLIALAILLTNSINQLIKSRQNIPVQKNLVTSSSINQSSSTQLVKVTRVIDGDTIEIENGQNIRYIGIDTPELHHPKKPVQCFGHEAMEKNKELVEGKQIRIEKDVSETDRYARLLRYVFLEHKTATSESIFVNDYLVKEGYAYAATFPPDVKYADLFRQSQNEAREKNKGLWDKCR